MNLYSYFRGHRIKFDGVTVEYIYCDTGKLVHENYKYRPCGNCGKFPTDKEHDYCIQNLHDAMNACCGHGNDNEAYVQFHDGYDLRGKKASEYFKRNRRK